MSPTSPQISRRSLAQGTAWAIPALALATAAPAYAASRCGPVTVGGSASAFYGWGADITTPNQSVTTNQTLRFEGSVSLSNLPPDAVITGISYTYWFQNRDDTYTNPNGATGNRGPGVYALGHARASTYNTTTGANRCTVSGSTVNGCQFTYGSSGSPLTVPTMTGVNTNQATNPFLGGSASARQVVNFTQHTFDNGRTAPAWQFVFTGDPARANNLLTTDANGCKSLALQGTPRMNVTYTGVNAAHGAQRTIQMDRYSTVTYTSGGQTYTVSRRVANTVFCNSSDQPGGVNLC